MFTYYIISYNIIYIMAYVAEAIMSNKNISNIKYKYWFSNIVCTSNTLFPNQKTSFSLPSYSIIWYF